MLTTSRLTWFVIAYGLAVPSMLVMFRDNGKRTSAAWISSLTLAAAIAVIVATTLGEGSS
ncbi:hypothetical protein ACFWZR_03920 [Streptomyces sp. NPDC059017]|uniref:hypothetical protein n=1 Tax=Streptomyces TaxID=1883 RepID=UPI00342E484C